MATKVKGDAIKEGSIPLSALATEVKDKIENAGGGADWEAKEGEAGYIENRTHYIEKTLLAEQCSVGGTTTEIENLPIAFRFSDNYEFESYPFVNLMIVDDIEGQKFDFRINIENKGEQDFDFGFIYVHEYDGSGVNISIASLMGNPVDLYEIKYNTINENYLPKTVLKTTPQSLSTNDKNQALANLGIDPVVWKYMCNPYVIPYDIPYPCKLPTELNEIIWNNTKNGPSALIYNLICRHDWYGIIRPISDWEIKYKEEGDSGNPSLYFNINDDLMFEIDIYGTVTEL